MSDGRGLAPSNAHFSGCFTDEYINNPPKGLVVFTYRINDRYCSSVWNNNTEKVSIGKRMLSLKKMGAEDIRYFTT